MMTTNPITNTDDVIDTRDVIARIDYLRSAWQDSTGQDPDDFALSGDDWIVGLGDNEGAEIVALLELADDGADYFADWQYVETLVRDNYFTDYARELADDIGAVPSDAGWPAYCIDWERAAREAPRWITHPSSSMA